MCDGADWRPTYMDACEQVERRVAGGKEMKRLFASMFIRSDASVVFPDRFRLRKSVCAFRPIPILPSKMTKKRSLPASHL